MIKTIVIEKVEDLKLLLDRNIVTFKFNWPLESNIRTKYQYPYNSRAKSCIGSTYSKEPNEGVPEDVYISCLACVVFGGTITAEKEVFHNYE